ncbi:MAG: right-handed parallel beta-helix repeat-containing protein [Caldilineaceae bacterium]|nr:right-handed parallel beta-helix repeat-containing protein [Caldilineaceae bacterium]
MMNPSIPNPWIYAVARRLLLPLAAALALIMSLAVGTVAHAADEPPQMSVNIFHNWVGVEADPNQEVNITVVGKATITGSTGDSGRFASHEWTWDPAQPEIGPGDTVTGTVGGVLMTVDPVGQIVGRADYDTDTVTGQIMAAWFSPTTLTVRCEAWAQNDSVGFEIVGADPDGGDYTCDFAAEGWDLQSEQTVAVFYIQPNGHRVFTLVEPPRPAHVSVNYGHDWVIVDGDPNVAVTVTADTGATITGMTNDSGFYASHDGTWTPEDPDLMPGDHVTVSVAGEIVAEIEIGSVQAAVDFDNDIVTGEIHAPWLAPEAVRVVCEIWNEEGAPAPIETAGIDPDGGSYVCDFSDVGWDLQADQMLAVMYVQPDEHRVINMPQAPRMRVNYGHDWVGGDYEIGHTFQITVTDGADVVKAVATIDSVAGGGWNGAGFQTEWNGWQPAQPDIRPGDWVHFRADDGYVNHIRVGDIGGIVDLDADNISGSIQADWFSDALNVECHPWGAWPGPAQLQQSTAMPDGSDSYACGWQGVWDVQPGQDIAVFYRAPGVPDLVGTVFTGKATRHVATTGSDTDNNCAIAASPCRTVQRAIDEGFDGEDILIAAGTYAQNLAIVNKDVSLRGGYDPSGATWISGSDATILQGVDDDASVVYIEDSEVMLADLSLTGGDAGDRGGGLHVRNSSVVDLIRVAVYSNVAGAGGGMAIRDTSTATIVDSAIYGNTARDGEGGGILAADSALTLTRSRVIANTAADNDGGGIGAEGSTLHIENSIIAGNDSATHGGGIWFFGDETATIVNSQIVGNVTAGEGAAVATKDASRVVMTNTLVISNTGNTGIADRDGGASVFILSHCDTYGNSPDGAANATITRSDCLGSPDTDGVDPEMAGGSLPGDTGSAFVDAWMAFDYRPLAGSPAIDAGDNAAAPATDITGATRPQDGDLDGTPAADMGAYEFTPLRNFLPLLFAK